MEILLVIGGIYIVYKVVTSFDRRDAEIAKLRKQAASHATEKTKLEKRVKELENENQRLRANQGQHGNKSYENDPQRVQSLQRECNKLRTALEQRKEQLSQCRRYVQELRRGKADNPSSELSASPQTASGNGANLAPKTTGEAVSQIEELARTSWYAARVYIDPKALKSAYEFDSYKKPQELVRSVQAVLEAGALYHDNLLHRPPAYFFQERNFSYSSSPDRHLKVDEGTSRDQCLRIHWRVDEELRMWEITHIGRHL